MYGQIGAHASDVPNEERNLGALRGRWLALVRSLRGANRVTIVVTGADVIASGQQALDL
jgi:hypothetical protein